MNDFDQTSRYSVKLDAAGFYRWLPGASVPLVFREWYDARTLPRPGAGDRTGDLIAFLAPSESPEIRAALITEFQTENDPEILERLLEEIARYRREFRARGIEVFGAVINLTGPVQESQLRMELPGKPAIGLHLNVEMRTMRDESAESTLAAIADGRFSRALLPWVPLMRDGGEPAIIQQWRQLAETEPDLSRQADYGELARNWFRLLPNAARQAWQEEFKGFNVTKSPYLEEVRAVERLENKRNSLIRAVQLRFHTQVPPDLIDVVNSTADENGLDRWFESVFTANSLDEFRAAIGH